MKANRVEVNPIYRHEYEGIVASGDVVDPAAMVPESVTAWMKWSAYDMHDEQQELVSMINKACHGDHHDKDCGICLKTFGVRRPHKKGAMTHQWSISADLSGPHPVAAGTNFTYLLTGCSGDDWRRRWEDKVAIC